MFYGKRWDRDRSGHIRLVHLDTVNSTNDYAFEHTAGGSGSDTRFLLESTKNCIAVIADNQTGGHGRLGREWVSYPGGSLTASFAAAIPQEAVTKGYSNWLTVLAGVAAADSLEDMFVSCSGASQPEDTASALPGGSDRRNNSGAAIPVPASLKLKWPNDIYMDGRKLGGILIRLGTDSLDGGSDRDTSREGTAAAGRGEPMVLAVIGIGINCAVPAEKFNGFDATSLSSVMDVPAAGPSFAAFRDGLAESIAVRLSQMLSDFKSSPSETCRYLRNRAEKLDFLRAQPVTVSLPSGETFTGTAKGISADASLTVGLEDGSWRRITVGDVSAGVPQPAQHTIHTVTVNSTVNKGR